MTTNRYTLTLAHGPNEDLMHDERKGYWQPPEAPAMAFVNVPTLKEARELFDAWRDANGFGAGNMTLVSGIVSEFPGGKFVGQFSFNGRFWDRPLHSTTQGKRKPIGDFVEDYTSDDGQVVPHYDDGTEAGL